MNFSSANKNLLNISLILYSQNKIRHTKVILSKPVLIFKLHYNPITSLSLINLDFLLQQTALSDKIIILPLCFYTFGFLLSIFFSLLTTRQYCYIYISKIYLSSEILISSFVPLYSFRKLFTKTNSS